MVDGVFNWTMGVGFGSVRLGLDWEFAGVGGSPSLIMANLLSPS